MKERPGDHWLAIVALAHWVAGLGFQCMGGWIVDPILYIMVPAAIAGAVAIGVWMSGARFTWLARIAWMVNWVAVMWVQIMICAAASAAV